MAAVIVAAAERHRPHLAMCILAISMLTYVVAGVAPAHGHSDLADSTPAQGESMTRPPSQIDLRFNEDISTQFAQVSLARDGDRTQRLRIKVQGPLLTAQVPRPTGALPEGRVTWSVAYRVVSADGHPITGTLEFKAPADVAEPRDTATEQPSSSPTPSQSPQVQATEPRAVEDAPQSSSGWLAVGLITLGVLATVGVGVVAARRRKRSAE